jgi:hypothetical protein
MLSIEPVKLRAHLAQEPSFKEPTGWPTWATWSWEGSYLPSDVHSIDGEVKRFLDMAVSTKISGLVFAMRVSLGLGLLLRECRRVIEHEVDEATSDTPTYINTSTLGIAILDLVMEAVSKIRGGVMRLLKARDIQDESPIVDKAAVGGHGAQDGAHVAGDGEEGVVQGEKQGEEEEEKRVAGERKDEEKEKEEKEKEEKEEEEEEEDKGEGMKDKDWCGGWRY